MSTKRIVQKYRPKYKSIGQKDDTTEIFDGFETYREMEYYISGSEQPYNSVASYQFIKIPLISSKTKSQCDICFVNSITVRKCSNKFCSDKLCSECRLNHHHISYAKCCIII